MEMQKNQVSCPLRTFFFMQDLFSPLLFNAYVCLND